MKQVLVVEHFEGTIREQSFELLEAAKAVSQDEKADITAVILGENVLSLAEEFSKKSGVKTVAINNSDLKTYNGEIYCKVLAEFLKSHGFSICLSSHTTQSLDFIPALSIRTGATCLTAIESTIQGEEGAVLFNRTICNEKIVTSVKPISDRLILSIQPGSFRASEVEQNFEPDVESVESGATCVKSRNLSVEAANLDNSGLTEAPVVVAVGRGIEDEENLSLIKDLAALFPKSAIAGSRPLCDLGWLEYRQQVGVTGATVAPKLYLACGISGASQHVNAMKGSGLIISINSDPNAAITKISDYCVVEDLMTFIPDILEVSKEI